MELLQTTSSCARRAPAIVIDQLALRFADDFLLAPISHMNSITCRYRDADHGRGGWHVAMPEHGMAAISCDAPRGGLGFVQILIAVAYCPPKLQRLCTQVLHVCCPAEMRFLDPRQGHCRFQFAIFQHAFSQRGMFPHPGIRV